MNNHESDLKDISAEEIFSFISDFPALLWRIEIKKARIEFLNNNTILSPGIDGALLLKNHAYRRSVILPEGILLFERFMDSVKESKNAATVFRVKNQQGKLTWLKLTGTVNHKDPRYYYGYLLNVDDSISVIKGNMGMDLDLELMIEDAENPQLIIHFDTLRLTCANQAAMQLLEISEDDFGEFPFSNLCPELMQQPLDNILKDLPLTRHWNGKLLLQSSNQKTQVQANALLRYLVHNDKQFIRFSLQQITISEKRKSSRSRMDNTEIQRLTQQLSSLEDITLIMQTCMESPLIASQSDAILFSDVYIRKNSVYVYWAGEPFAEMEQAESFAYKGTIAEDINRYSLDYLSVDDTQDSIKPIDWALFVPRGIRSYFALPYYSRGVLRTVLILCSIQPSRYSGKRPPDFKPLLDPINEAVRNWRRQQR